ncbi:MAG: hypothetical protein WC843_01985 [Candidatus Gracilibacteria bacterium]|jgi:hypothetical protein
MNLPEDKKMPPGLNIPIKSNPLPILDCTRLGLRPLEIPGNHDMAIFVAISAAAIAATMAFVDPAPSSPETQPNPPSAAHSAKK